MSRVSIIGSGWAGENAGRGLQEFGHDVIFYDISREKIRELLKNNLQATNDLSRAIQDSETSFLCVSTPTEEGKINLKYLRSATEKIAAHLKDKDEYHVVTIKSTVVPGTTESTVIPTLENNSGKKVGKGIGVCVNPEFMTEISDTWTKNDDFKRRFSEDRVIIGEYDEKSGDQLENLYKSSNVPIVRTDLKTAEMIKYACNCVLSTKISYWNEIFLICKHLNIDSDLVSQVAAMDPRIGKYGTVHGKAFGGKCLPKDLQAFITFVENELGKEPELLKAVEKINNYMAEKYGIRE